MDERIRIEFEALGLDSMMSNAKELEATLRTLSGKKAINFRDSSIKDLRRDLDRIKNFKLRLSVARTNELARIRREIQALRDTKVTLQTDYSKAQEGIKAYQRQISAVKKELKSLELKGELTKSMRNSLNGMIGGLTRAKNTLAKNFEKTWGIPLDYDRYIGKMMTDYVNPMLQKQNERAHAKEYFDEMERQANEASANIRTHLSEIKNMDITPRFNVEKLYSTIRNFQMRLGSSMQSIGNGLTRLTSSVNYLLRGSLYTMAYKGINMITEGLSGATERYDIMERYPDIIEAMGGSAKVAKGEVQKLYNAVLGLPTGLDTIVDAQKQYFLALQGGYKDQNKALKRASDIAIAANNAFVAGGASEEQIIFGQRQLRDLLSAGKLRNQEWQSLAKAIPNAMSAIQKDLGVTRSDIMSGKVSADKFINSLLKVASAGGPVAKAAEKMKHTFTAVQSNIRNALRNAGYEGIKALDQIFMAYNGKDVIDNLLGIKPFIQDIAKDIQDWAKANPDKITDFFERIKSIDIKGFLSGVASGFGNIIKLIGTFSGVLSSLGGNTLGKMLIYGNFLGKFLSGFGGIVRGTAGVNAGFFTGIAFLTSRLVNFFKTTETASKLAKISIVDKIANFFKRFKTVEKAATASAGTSGFKAVNRKLAKTGAEATELATTTANMSTSLKQVGANLLKSISPAITVGAYVGVFWGAVKAIESIGNTKINLGNTVKNLATVSGAMFAMTGVMKGLEKLNLVGGGSEGLKSSAIGALQSLLSTGVFTLVAKLLEQINKVNLGDGFFDIHAKLAQIGLAIAEMQAFMTGLGLLFGNAVTFPMQLLGNLSAVLTSSAWVKITNALQRIAKLKVPNNYQIKRVATAFENLRNNLFDGDWWDDVWDANEAFEIEGMARNIGKTMKSMVGIFKYTNSALKEMGKISKIDDTSLVGNVNERLNDIKLVMRKMTEGFNEIFGLEEIAKQPTTMALGAGQTPKKYMYDGVMKRFERYREMLEGVGEAIRSAEEMLNQTLNFGKISTTLVKKGEKKNTTIDLIEKSIANIGEIEDWIKTIYSNMETQFKGKSTTTAAGLQRYEARFKSYDSMIKAVKQVVSHGKQIIDKLLEIGTLDTKGAMATAQRRLAKLLGGDAEGKKYTGLIPELAETIDSAFKSLLGDEEEKNKLKVQVNGATNENRRTNPLEEQLARIKGYGDLIGQVSATIGQIKPMMDKLKQVKEGIKTALEVYGGEGDRRGKTKDIDALAIQNDIQKIVDVVNAIVGEDAESGLGALKKATERLQGVDLESIKGQLDMIPQVLTTLSTLKNALAQNSWINGVQEGNKAMVLGDYAKGFGEEQGFAPDSYGQDVTGMLGTITAMVQTVIDIAEQLTRVPDTIQADAQRLSQGIVAIQGAVSAMTNLRTAVAADQNTGTSVESLATTIQTYITKLNIALLNAPILLQNAMTFQLAVGLLKTALNSITNGGDGSIQNFIDGLNSIPGALDAVNQAMMNRGTEWKNQLVNGFKGTAEKIKAEIDKIATMLSGLNYWSQGYSAGNSFAQGYNAGLANMRSPSLPSLPSIFPHTGGFVTDHGLKYMRKGGVVGNVFKPKGIDKIPAMLAEGEYVMNRNAVSAFGTRFMQKINNLDLKGAIASLGVKGGQLAYATPTTVIDRSKHITYNNNQQLTMNNNNASQGYSEIRASRYLRNM